MYTHFPFQDPPIYTRQVRPVSSHPIGNIRHMETIATKCTRIYLVHMYALYTIKDHKVLAV
jgi:hypothetical protein